MHPKVTEFVEKFESNARRLGHYRNKLGKAELAFLEEVWGPILEYNFEGLETEYPFKDYKGGERFADFIYLKDGMKLLIEIDGFTTHARDISPGEFSDHLIRQNDLVLQGWMILRFTAYQVEKKPMLCQRVIMQAMGHWWALMHRNSYSIEGDIWSYRSQQLTQMMFQYGGIVKLAHIAKYFHIPIRTARDWTERFVKSGLLTAVKPGKRAIGYQLSRFTGSGR